MDRKGWEFLRSGKKVLRWGRLQTLNRVLPTKILKDCTAPDSHYLSFFSNFPHLETALIQYSEALIKTYILSNLKQLKKYIKF